MGKRVSIYCVAAVTAFLLMNISANAAKGSVGDCTLKKGKKIVSKMRIYVLSNLVKTEIENPKITTIINKKTKKSYTIMHQQKMCMVRKYSQSKEKSEAKPFQKVMKNDDGSIMTCDWKKQSFTINPKCPPKYRKMSM